MTYDTQILTIFVDIGVYCIEVVAYDQRKTDRR